MKQNYLMRTNLKWQDLKREGISFSALFSMFIRLLMQKSNWFMKNVCIMFIAFLQKFLFSNKTNLLRLMVILILSGLIYFRDFNLPLQFDHLPNNGKRPNTASIGNSEFAPADISSLGDDQNVDYINKYKKVAIDEMHRSGVPASITLAQAIIESRAGKSKLAEHLNNHFGIKCFSHDCMKGHCQNYTDDSHKDFFRNFKNVKDCYKAHSAVVLKNRYTRLLRGRKSYKAWAMALQEGGYATGSQYAKKLIGVINRYQLQKLDSK